MDAGSLEATMAHFVNQNNILVATSNKGFQFIISFHLTLGLISAHCQHFVSWGCCQPYDQVHWQIWPLHCCTLPAKINYFIFSLCSHMLFSNSLLFMSMSNLILINILFMDMRRHMLISLFISMLMDREKEWDSYKMKVVIKNDPM
jgi:hypothetical protein